MSAQKLAGGCQCGRIRYAIAGETALAGICHCTMCRRANAAPAVAWATFYDLQVEFIRQPQQFQSSDQAQRGFCPECGTQISFTATFLPELIDITIGSLDNPEAIQPTSHYWYSEHLSWVNFADELPRYSELPPFDGTKS